MSIPPLVCSTPPPPDQCEDDKEPDDFDLHYHLSQEDDDDSYEYGGFTNYNQSQSPPDKPSQNATDTVVQSENEISERMTKTENFESIAETLPSATYESKVEEEINIEDLNLNIDDDDVIEKPDFTEALDISIKVEDIRNTDIIEDSASIDIAIVDQERHDAGTSTQTYINNEPFDTLKDTSEPSQEESPVKIPDFDPTDLIESEKCVSQAVPESSNFILDHNPTITAKELDRIEPDDSDFGDFDEFHCTTVESESAPALETCENPWASEEPTDDDFGNFKANFDDNDSNFSKLETDIIHSNDGDQNKSDDQPDNQINKVEKIDDNVDDFCDFEEFQSSAGSNEQETSKEEMSCPQIPFLNLRIQDNEDQFVDNVNKVLCEIFEHEMPIVEEVDKLGVQLESFLGETWGHLLEIDTRQPYMVNWNNSLGQKTLLKALCIDSRNILFGSKWSYNMPKYAANLSVAPLQPQKPAATATTVSQPDTTGTDKSVAKSSTWSDPFNTETQEFTYAEALLLDLEHLMATLDQMANNHSSVKISELLSQACNPDSGSDKPAVEAAPIDLDMFEVPVSSKPDKLYPGTLNVQPIRQISLPDTHIFTPTDSEIPRSKTIHYDNVTPVLLPQTVIDNKNTSQNLTPQPSTPSTSKTKEDTEYWDFQDFKSVAPTQGELEASTSIPKPEITHGTQVLEPIKLEPIMPTLNWPAPGEVKEIFEDFSDFISSTARNNDKQDISTTHITMPVEINKPIAETKIVNSAVNSPTCDPTVAKDVNTIDDDFDTFQSALPPNEPTGINVNFAGLNNNINIAPSTSAAANNVTSFDSLINKPTDFSNMPRSNINFMQSPTTFSHIDKITSKVEQTNIPIKPTPPNILQPTIAKSNHSQQKSTQILQPLSLEGYSQINWPNPGIDLQDLSRFNPVETLQSLKTDLSTNSQSKTGSPIQKPKNTANLQPDEDWGEFVSSKPKQQPLTKKPQFPDDDEWTDFISSPNVKPQNGVNTISFNVHTNLNTQKMSNQNKFSSKKTNQSPLDIPSLNYVTPKGAAKSFNDRHFQNL